MSRLSRARDRVSHRIHQAADNISDEFQNNEYVRVTASIVGGPIVGAYLYQDEFSDLWRRDDRQLKKFENRAERAEADYQRQVRDLAYIRAANQAARVSRMMYGSTSIGDAQSMTGRPLSTAIGGGEFMNRYLGGGS